MGPRNDAEQIGFCDTFVAAFGGLNEFVGDHFVLGALMLAASGSDFDWEQRVCSDATQQSTRPTENDAELERFRSIYKELVETNTTLSVGDCTLAAKRMAARLKAAGYPAEDMQIFVPDGHPKEGGLIAVLHGTDPNAKAILMLAHVDVVEAKREDWTRDPFKLIEESGYFYGRGTSDMKAQAAIWVDNMIRYREEGFKPKRSIKLALTCGEETNSALNGAGGWRRMSAKPSMRILR